MQRRTDVMRELVGRAGQCVLRWFGHLKRIEDRLLVGSDV